MIRTIHDIPTPARLIDIHVLEDNIARNQNIAFDADVELLPHVKTHNCPEIARQQVEAGATGFTAATLTQAEMAAQFSPHVLIAMPLVDRHRLERAKALRDGGTDITLTVDSVRQAVILKEFFGGKRNMPHVLLEVATGDSFPARLGVKPDKNSAITTAEEIHRLLGDALCGLMTHEGHAYVVKIDPKTIGKKLTNLAERSAFLMGEFAEKCRQKGIPIERISVGSTPTFKHTLDMDESLREIITEIRPGIAVFNDFMQVLMQTAHVSDCALTVLASVVGKRPQSSALITNAGSKTMSSDKGPHGLGGSELGYGAIFKDITGTELIQQPAKGKQPTKGNALSEYLQVSGLSEHHGKIFLRDRARHDKDKSRHLLPGTHHLTNLGEGDLIRLLPNHSCTAVNTATGINARYYVMDGDKVVDIWPITANGDL